MGPQIWGNPENAAVFGNSVGKDEHCVCISEYYVVIDSSVRLSIRLHIPTSSACGYTYILALSRHCQLDDLEGNNS